MDLASVFGLVGGIAVILITILISGDLIGYVDIPSIICTFGGTIAMTFMAFPIKKLKEGIAALKYVFVYAETDAEYIIKSIIDLANTARKEGLLALEEAAQQLKDDFLQKGILLIVDGTDPELVRNILETELSFIEERHKSNQGVYEFMAAIGPGFGMLGTLIGLINMLANLSDPSTVGPNMAVAIVTTLYGSIIANVFCNPVISKLKIRSSQESLMKEVMLEGMLSIQAGENPRIIEEKLKAFMSPKLRNMLDSAKEPKEGEE
ncbi:MAG TPA: MotA/TolQ/ExbB proton channel family protein [Bacillota bacterium]|nr:MotA/TolQ/ExbB proton channel family protein [Clostridiaceae bacterium]HNR04471.1 MotA/TolQ/ExbB proton channel family protein [Bacillota bacterium]HNT02296.1 MotA/TolQ/ExbB proton channel family protein [Bacillota bacterium]HPX68157.1 MotA/TolQ/ExbB proton channel family protein [Bacillota bacterium]HQA64533.1 MotA/TolQ/ExbB proton channel family protein [Bacillota bacterium]